MEEKLKIDYSRPDLSAILRKVQDQERQKLRLTLSLQSLNQAFAYQTFSWQHEEDIDILEHKPPRSCGCSSHDDPEEISEADFRLAVRDAKLSLDTCIQAINDCLEEVREAIEEIKET